MKSKHCKELTPTQAAYIAGFIDGEGCISIVKTTHNFFAITITVVNTKTAPLAWMVDVTGLGKVSQTKASNERWADRYDWQVSAEGAETLLRKIHPYLLIKGPQALLAISLQEGLRIPRLKVDKAWQRTSFETMHVLNKRGPKAALSVGVS